MDPSHRGLLIEQKLRVHRSHMNELPAMERLRQIRRIDASKDEPLHERQARLREPRRLTDEDLESRSKQIHPRSPRAILGAEICGLGCHSPQGQDDHTQCGLYIWFQTAHEYVLVACQKCLPVENRVTWIDGGKEGGHKEICDITLQERQGTLTQGLSAEYGYGAVGLESKKVVTWKVPDQ